MERFLSTYVPVASIMCFVVVSTFRQHGGGCVAAIRHEEHSSRDVSTCHIVPAMHTWWAAVVWVGLCGVGGAMYAQAPFHLILMICSCLPLLMYTPGCSGMLEITHVTADRQLISYRLVCEQTNWSPNIHVCASNYWINSSQWYVTAVGALSIVINWSECHFSNNSLL